MRWTVREIPVGTADAVRDLAYATGTTLGNVVRLCVEIGLPEARRRLAAEHASDGELDTMQQTVKQASIAIREAISKLLPTGSKAA